MSMTKKDFEAIATTFRLEYLLCKNEEQMKVIDGIIISLCINLKDNNPRFDDMKFKEACDHYFRNV